MKLYIAGPCTGFIEYNRPSFERAAAELQAEGYDVVIPHDYVPTTATHDEAMNTCIPLMLSCDGVALLPGWWDSKGALMEVRWTRRYSMPALGVNWWLSRKAVG